MQSVPRYPEVREDGSMWVPLAPPPAPTYRQLSANDRDVVGLRAVVSYSTEWLLDLRVLTDPYQDDPDQEGQVVRLCDEGAWHDFSRHAIAPAPQELIVTSVRLVFVVLDGQTACRATQPFRRNRPYTR